MRESDRTLERARQTIDRQREQLRRDREDTLAEVYAAAIVISGLVLACAAFVQCASPAGAQRRPTEVEVLARITVHETGWADTGDAEAIFAVLVAGAEREGVSWRRFAELYSPRIAAGTVSRRWAAELVEDCSRPPSWPEVVTVQRGDEVLVERHAPWAAFRGRCLDVMARVREVLAGERTHGCERTPHDWGGRVDRARAARLGLVEIDCSRGDVGTVGDYYVRPSLLGREEGR